MGTPNKVSPLPEAPTFPTGPETVCRMRAPALSKNSRQFGTDDAFSRSVEIVVTPVIFAGGGWLLDRWLDTGPWIAVALGSVAFLGKITAEWYRYNGRMGGIELEMVADRPTNSRGLDVPHEIDVRLPAGVNLDRSTDQ